MTVASKSRLTPGRRMLLWAVIAAPLGYLVGKQMASAEKAGLWTAPDLGWSDALALFLGMLMLAVGLVTVGVSTSRKALGRQVDPERGAPVSRALAGFYALSGWVLVLAAMMMAAPVVVGIAFDPVPPEIASATMIGLIALLLVQTASNITLWLRSDELMRKATAEICALTFVILQGALFLWAAGEKLALLPTLTLWDAVSVMMTAYLLIAVVITWRRGLA
jgi:hypothetical protein